MSDKKNFYITTAIVYPNGAPHIGHAYELIATDAIARFFRLDGYNVYFQTGSDEHGIKMVQTAREQGISPQELADKNAKIFKEMGPALGCAPDRFIRTTEKEHYEACQAIWKKMKEKGDIYKDSYSGWYSVRDEAYYDESETEIRDDKKRYGPQGTPVEWVNEESYFFKLSAYSDKLLDFYEKNPAFISPKERKNEIVRFVEQGLRDLSISRTTFDWGVPVPEDENHVMYVWVDALTNYLTGLGYPNEQTEAFKTFWPANIHIIGKDITRFHAIYWPAFLMSADIELPKQVFGHGFVLNKGEKMSKSVGNVLDPFALAQHYGIDQLRYFMLREVPFGQDGSYSHEAIVNRVNADLANDLGNLAQRSLSMVFKNLDGALKQPDIFTEEDQALLDMASQMLEKAREVMSNYTIHRYVAIIWAVVSEANRYFAAQEPWALKKTDPDRMSAVLYITAEIVRQVGILAQPIVPESASKLLDLLKIPQTERNFDSLKNRLSSNTIIDKPQGIFPRYIDNKEA